MEQKRQAFTAPGFCWYATGFLIFQFNFQVIHDDDIDDDYDVRSEKSADSGDNTTGMQFTSRAIITSMVS